MKKTASPNDRSHLQWLLGLSVLSWTLSAPANPVGGTVNQGTASFTSLGSQFTIRTSDRTYINWQSFNIGLGETTSFLQPSSSSVVWNHINDPNASQILGNLNANGYVILQNQNGFFIGGQAVINTHGLLMTTAPIPMPDLSTGGPWDIKCPPPSASIINYGQINVEKGGSVFLISHDIDNHGTIWAPEGNIGLYAGKEVLVSDRPDGRGLSARVTLPAGSIDNSGKLIADAGTIAINAQVVNQGGLIQANSVREVNGSIELFASDAVNLGSSSVIAAKGDSQGTSAGGSVVIKSASSFSDKPGSMIDVAGGAQGGDGGQVEISASQISAINSSISGHAVQGFTSGKLFIDPANIVLASFGDNAPGSGTVNPNDPPSAGSSDTLTLNVESFNSLIAQNALSQISLSATKNIEISTLWNLPASQDPSASLTLTAGNKITLDDGSGIAAGKNWSINLFAGPQNLTAKPLVGTDGIYLQGNSYIQTQNGNINLWAANEVIINSGENGDPDGNGIRTSGGGNIHVATQYGDVNAGANTQGFSRFRARAPYYTVSGSLGGISTAAGGDVDINAGGDVISYLPLGGSGPQIAGDAGIGAFGPQAGNVNITAGGSVFGHYVVANGSGAITSGGNVGGPNANANVALSLISGSWTINALHGSIYLQEVRNPNGTFNDAGGPSSLAYHLFDYGPKASVNLNAQAVYLTGLSLPRPAGDVPMIFPPTLTISAGAGGITLGDTVILFPSPYGDLQLTTVDGGDLVATPNNPLRPAVELIMSDSGATRWLSATTFGDIDHGTTPLELNNPDPAVISVSGDLKNVILITSKETHIKVGGDMQNSSFSGQNLHASDVTSIDVAGQIYNRSPYSFVILNQSIQNVPAQDSAPNSPVSWSTIFSVAVDPSLIATLHPDGSVSQSQLAAYAGLHAGLFPFGNPGFVYNPVTRRLGFNGTMPQAVLAALQQPLTVLRYGPDGYPMIDSNGHFVTDRVIFANAAAIADLYAASQGAPSASDPASLGYRIGGPGQFNVHAGSISLGNTYGILSCGVGDPAGNRYANLAPFTRNGGADLNVTVDEDLTMLTSTIAALGGGNVNVVSTAGSLDLGSQELLSGPRGLAFGIYTSGKGDVKVIALGNININGSRIAAYNGGDISVTSLEGDVDAGTGGTTFVTVPVFYIDPTTGKSGFYGEQVFGSGIVATTLVNPSKVPGSAVAPGNITVATPQGSIYASQGGILQEALNGNVSAGPTVTLTAGSDGHPGNIDLGESGVIGGTVNATANGNITGLVISRQNSTINAAQSFSGTVLSGGTANLSAGGTISGTIVGVGGISASGAGISATLLSQNVSVGGAQAQSSLGTSAAATSTSQAAAQQANTDTQKTVALEDSSKEDDNKKKKTGPTLTRRVGRVTVILPPGS